MKKFDRLPPEARKAEIKAAALELFREKGFAACTMENIVSRVTLSKGGVYRIYPSTAAILGDLMIDGSRVRNQFYARCIQERTESGSAPDLPFLIGMICDSLLIHPELSDVYVEFLLEKRRNPTLEALYQQVCAASLAETEALIRALGADEMFLSGRVTLSLLTDLMNTAILGLSVLGLRDAFAENKERLAAAMTDTVARFCRDGGAN